jgi:hypothetical protein
VGDFWHHPTYPSIWGREEMKRGHLAFGRRGGGCLALPGVAWLLGVGGEGEEGWESCARIFGPLLLVERCKR